MKNLFDPTAPLDDVESWLLDRDAVDNDRFEVIGAALKEVLMLHPDCRFVRARGAVEVVFVGGVRVQLRMLSDGFQSVVALCADIMKILLDWWPSVEDAEGIVLLDELEAHLHPSWKIEMVERLRRSFPRVAFLASTHDPLCLKGLEEGEIVLLEFDPERRTIVNRNLPPVNDLRADQILTSVLFGLHTTRGDDAAAAMRRYETLLGKRRRSAPEQAELEQLESRLEAVMSATETPQARAVEQALWRAVVDGDRDALAAAPAAPAARRRRRGRATAEELELRRQLAELLGPVTTP